MARTKGNGAENKLPRAETSPEEEASVLGEMPAGEMNGPAHDQMMIAARPGIDTPVPGVSDETTMPSSGRMDDGEPGVLGSMPGEDQGVSGSAAAGSETVEATGNGPSTQQDFELTGAWRLTFTISGIKRA